MPKALYGDGGTSFETAGGHDGVASLVEAFYGYMDTLPEAATIRGMHASDLSESIEKLKVFLAGWLGGPREYASRFGKIKIPRVHAHLSIDEAERDAWLLCMQKAVAEQDAWPGEFKEYFLREISRPAEKVRQASVERRQEES